MRKAQFSLFPRTMRDWIIISLGFSAMEAIYLVVAWGRCVVCLWLWVIAGVFLTAHLGRRLILLVRKQADTVTWVDTVLTKGMQLGLFGTVLLILLRR
jgi:hypothetical protein